MCVIVADYRSRAVWCEWVRHEAREHELLTSTSLTETEETGAEQMVSGHCTGAGTGSHSFVATIAIILSLPPCEIT